MNDLDPAEDLTRRFGTASLVAGILLLILGAVGFFLPHLMSLGTAIFVAWLLLFGGLVWAYHAYRYGADGFLGWLKPVLLILTGGIMLYSPQAGVAAIGLFLALYLMLDAFGSFALAHALHPAPGWGWMAFNGIVSLLLALLFLVGWPVTSLWLVGLYIGISLFFDGAVLVALGLAARNAARRP